MNELVGAIISKKALIVVISILLGAFAHALDTVRKIGWRGWASFISDTFISIFTGYVFFHVAIIACPEYTAILCSLGAFWGVSAFKYLKTWLFNTLKANLK